MLREGFSQASLTLYQLTVEASITNTGCRRLPPESDTDPGRWVPHHLRKCVFESCRERNRLCESLTVFWFSLGRITAKNARGIPAALLRFYCAAQAKTR